MPVTIGLVIGGIGAVTGAGSAANKARDRKLRREFEQNLAALDLEQKRELEKKVLAAKTLEEKKKIIFENLSKQTESRVKAIQDKKMEQKRVTNNLIIIGAVSIAALVIALIINRKKGK